jgi:hypothetical protein
LFELSSAHEISILGSDKKGLSKFCVDPLRPPRFTGLGGFVMPSGYAWFILAVMDSKDVSREIRSRIRPLLKGVGFSEFSSRTAWRFNSTRVDVVNFQSFNADLAEGLHSTTYSFALNLGCYFTFIPDRFGNKGLKFKGNFPLPEEARCPFRRQLHKTIQQPELSRSDIWYIDRAGKWLGPCIYDAGGVIARGAFPWFERFSDDAEVLRTLQDQSGENDTWGFGTFSSPIRHYLTGYTALYLKKYDLAIAHLEMALVLNCFQSVNHRIQSDIATARAELRT